MKNRKKLCKKKRQANAKAFTRQAWYQNHLFNLP